MPKFKIMNKKNKIKKEEFFSTLGGPASGGDDCPICRAMKKAQEQGREPTSEELKEAFKKAKEGGAMVGGEWFENKK